MADRPTDKDKDVKAEAKDAAKKLTKDVKSATKDVKGAAKDITKDVKQIKKGTREEAKKAAQAVNIDQGSSRLFMVSWIGLMLFGLVWVMVYYVSNGDLPLGGIPELANLGIGMAFVLAGFALMTRWK